MGLGHARGEGKNRPEKTLTIPHDWFLAVHHSPEQAGHTRSPGHKRQHATLRQPDGPQAQPRVWPTGRAHWTSARCQEKHTQRQASSTSRPRQDAGQRHNTHAGRQHQAKNRPNTTPQAPGSQQKHAAPPLHRNATSANRTSASKHSKPPPRTLSPAQMLTPQGRPHRPRAR